MKINLSNISGILFVLGMVLFISACSQKADVQADIEAIKELNKEWMAALNAGDAVRIAACWTEDGIEMPLGKVRIGKEAIRTRMQSVFQGHSAVFTVSIDEIIVDDNYAFMRTTSNVQWTPTNGGEVSLDNSKRLTVLRRQPDGSWKVARHMFNSNDVE